MEMLSFLFEFGNIQEILVTLWRQMTKLTIKKHEVATLDTIIFNNFENFNILYKFEHDPISVK